MPNSSASMGVPSSWKPKNDLTSAGVRQHSQQRSLCPARSKAAKYSWKRSSMAIIGLLYRDSRPRSQDLSVRDAFDLERALRPVRQAVGEPHGSPSEEGLELPDL